MHFQRGDKHQYQTQNNLNQNYQERFPRLNRYDREIIYNRETEVNKNKIQNPKKKNIEQRGTVNYKEGINPQNINKSTSLNKTTKDNINEKYTRSQLLGQKNLSSALHFFPSRLNDERNPSPKTINIGDTKETIEYNIRTLNARRSPRLKEQFYQNQEIRMSETNENDMRNGSFDEGRFFNQNMTYYERGPNIMSNRSNDYSTSINFETRPITFGNINNGPPRGGIIALGDQLSPYENYDEINSSNDYEKPDSEQRNNYIHNNKSTFDIRQNPYENQSIYMNNLNNYNNYTNYNNINNISMNQNINTGHFPLNNAILPQDDIHEKYTNKTYDNVVYKDVKKIIKRFTKVYEPIKNNDGLLIEKSQMILPGANDEIFYNRHRVLAKMKRLSNFLLSRKTKSSPKKSEDIFNFDGIGLSYKFNVRRNKSFNRLSFEERAKSPLTLPNRKSPENKFKYVSLAMISSKGLKTENRIIFRRMRFEKGGVVDLAQEKIKGKYKIRNVSRSHGYKNNFYRINPKYRERAAKYIQEWWRNTKERKTTFINKIIKIQSVYRGRFVRKYLYDLLYLNYIYLSFCQKIEKVLKEKIKPYVFDILRNYGKETSEDIKDFNILKNLVASKAKKWKILNLRRSINKWRRVLRNRDKLILLIYKLLKSRIEKKNKKSILLDAIRKWNYIVNTDKMIKNFEEEKLSIKKKIETTIFEDDKNEKDLKKIINEKESHIKKIKGLFKILKGTNKYCKKLALEPTMPKLKYHLSNDYLTQLLKKIINSKIIAEKEILREYFYKYIKMTLKYIKNRINELPKELKEEKLKLEIKPKKKLLKDTIIETEPISNEEKDKLEKLLKEMEDKQKNEELKMKARILLYLVNNVKNNQNKKILKKYFTKYFKKIIQLQREEDRKNFEEQQKRLKEKIKKEKEEERNLRLQMEKEINEDTKKNKELEKELNEEREKLKRLQKESQKDRKELDKTKEEIENLEIIIKKKKTVIDNYKPIDENEIYNKLNKELVNKLNALEILNKLILRHIYKYVLEAFKIKFHKLRKNKLLLKILKIRKNVRKNILKKYFNIWKNNTFDKYKKDTIRNIFIKILTIIIDNFYKRLLHKKLYQWKRNTTIVHEEPNIYNTLKIIKDIINFNDYLRNLSINKYGKKFLKNLSKTRNPKLFSKYLKKILKKKILNDKSILRKAFNTWKNNVDTDNEYKTLKTRLIYALYDKNKNINENNTLQKWFNKWRNIIEVEKIKEKINEILISEKDAKIITIKSIIRNNDRNKKNYILKKYLNKWRNVVKSDIPRLNKLIEKITKVTKLINATKLLNNLNIKRDINKKNDLLIRIIRKSAKNKKILLYKYLLRWRNKIYGINGANILHSYRKKIFSILLNKNDKENLLKAFNKWKYGKDYKLPTSTYLVSIKKIKNIICKKPFRKFVEKMDKTNPKKLRPKAIVFEKIFKKITKEKPFEKLIKNINIKTRIEKLKIIQPKIHDIIKKYYLDKYLKRWKDNVSKERKKNMKIISKWLKKKYNIEKDKKDKRKKELLKRIINNILKDNKYRLRFPLYFWKRIANIYTENHNARIIQNFCRRILLKLKKKKLNDQKKLTNLIIKLYKKNIIKTVTDQKDVGQVNKFIKTKKDNIKKKKLVRIFKNRDKNNRKLLLKLAILKWKESKPKHKYTKITKKEIRHVIYKKKIKNMRLLQILLRHIIANIKNRNKTVLRNKFLKWYAIAKKINIKDTSKIEEFIKKIINEKLKRKMRINLDKYTNKYPTYIIKNIARFYKFKNILRKKPTKDALDKIKNYIRRKKIKNNLDNIVKDKDDNLRILLLKKYIKKWNQKVKELNNKDNNSIIIIQKYIRGRKVKNDVDRKIKIKKILKNIIYRYRGKSPLYLYIVKWERISQKIICEENAKIIQNFCKKIHDKYLIIKKNKNKKAYNKLVDILSKLGKKPKKDFLDKLYNIYRNKIVKKIVNDLNNKRKDILKNAFYKMKNNTKLRILRNILNIKQNQRRKILKKYLIQWRNNTLSSKYIDLYLTKFLKKKDRINDNILRSILYKWLYKAHFITVIQKEKIISKFYKDIARKISIIKKWREISDKLRNKKRKYEIDDIYKKLRTLLSLQIINKIVKKNVKKDVNNKLHKQKDKSTFIEKITIVVQKVNTNLNDNSIKKYFNIWRNNTKKIKDRLNKLDQLMNILGLKQKKDGVITLYYISLIKKLLKDIPKLYLINAFRRIKDFSYEKNNNERLAGDLLRSQKDIKTKRISPLIKKLYKVYAFKVIDKLFNNIQRVLKRKSKPLKYLFIKRLEQYLDKDKEYKYSNQIKNENEPIIKKLSFRKKKLVHPKIIQDKSKIYLALVSYLVKILDGLIKNNKKNSFNNIKKKSILERLIIALRKYIYYKEKPNFQEFIERLRILIDKYEHDGPQKVKLFKLLRKIIIKKLFIYKEKVYHFNKIAYLVNLTIFNIEISRSRWLRKIIRKWRFITFMKKMARRKLELMYKNLHCSYLEMINTIFSEEETNPSVMKELERFGNGIGLYVNESPYEEREERFCLGIKKKYLFQPVEFEKMFEIKKKVVSRKIKSEEKILTSEEIDVDLDTRHGRKNVAKTRSEQKESIGSKYKTSSSGKVEDLKESKYGTSSSKKKEDIKEDPSKSKNKSKLKVQYSTKPLDKKEKKEKEKEIEYDDEENEEENEEKEENEENEEERIEK